ncbi:MAG TPA: outer membrane protein transport protein [Kofleriaceae bacterium]|nr:outer membrane protein transport protein [Kofleriaceae bacterium]
MTHRPRLLRSAFASATLVAAPLAAHAGGLVLPGTGPVSTGRAGAAVASVDDPTAIAINPAGLAGIHGTVITLGLSLIDYHLTFDRQGTYDDVPDRDDPWEGQPFAPVTDQSKPAIGFGHEQLVPVLAIASDLGGAVKGLTVAAGVYAPNAYPTRSMGADYVLEDPNTPPPPTRYDIIEQNAAIVLPSVAAAYRINDKLDAGLRLSWGLANIEATTYVWGLPNFEEWAGKDARFHVKTKDNFVPTGSLGLRFRPTDSIELGATWSSAIKVDSHGTGDNTPGSGNKFGDIPIQVVPVPDDMAACAKGGTAEALKACVTFQLPMTATLGGRWVRRDGAGHQVADLELDVDWENWKAASDYDIVIDGAASVGPPPNSPTIAIQESLIKHNFKDTYSARLGGSWQRAVGSGRLTLRGGVAYETKAANTNWERADIDGAARTIVTAGASYQVAKWRFDVGGGAAIEPTRDQGTLCNPTSGTDEDPNCAGGPSVTGPDPVQPTVDSSAQAQSPFAAGTFQSGYALVLLGATTWF